MKENYHAFTVWVDCDIAELIRRDTKGLYKRALLPDDDPAKIVNLTGINDTYESPEKADLILDTSIEIAQRSAKQLYRFIVYHPPT